MRGYYLLLLVVLLPALIFADAKEEVEKIRQEIKKLDKTQRKIARDYFLNGISLRRISRKYRLPYYKARKIISIVEKTTTNRTSKVSERKY